MKRLTTDNPKGNFESLMNFAYAKDNKVFIPQPYKEDIDLCEYIANSKKKECSCTAESVLEGCCLECDRDCELGILYYCAVQAPELRERLKLYEDKLENGTLIDLPCKVGDTVYSYCYEFHHILPYFIENINIGFLSKDRAPYISFEANSHSDETDDFLDEIDFDLDYIGKTVFLTEEEAEARLKEMNDNAKI